MAEYNKKIYHTLDTILLCDFYELWLGDLAKTARNGRIDDEREAAAVASELMQKYMTIIGGVSAAAELSRRNTILKLEMRLVVLRAALALAKSGQTDDAAKVMESLGYHLQKLEGEKMAAKINGVIGSDSYRLDTLQKQESEKPQKNEIDMDYFTQERVAVMRWAKMHIDTKITTAAEYAYLIKGMSEELKQQQKQLNELKSKTR